MVNQLSSNTSTHYKIWVQRKICCINLW